MVRIVEARVVGERVSGAAEAETPVPEHVSLYGLSSELRPAQLLA